MKINLMKNLNYGAVQISHNFKIEKVNKLKIKFSQNSILSKGELYYILVVY
jgi:hypothetical protein